MTIAPNRCFHLHVMQVIDTWRFMLDIWKNSWKTTKKYTKYYLFLCKHYMASDSLHSTLVFWRLGSPLCVSYYWEILSQLKSIFSIFWVFIFISDILLRILLLWMRGIVVFICSRAPCLCALYICLLHLTCSLDLDLDLDLDIRFRFIDERHIFSEDNFRSFTDIVYLPKLLPWLIEITCFVCTNWINLGSNAKFWQVSNYWKKIPEDFKIAYPDTKTKEPITSQKLDSYELWRIANSIHNKGKPAIPLHFNDPMVSSTFDKRKLSLNIFWRLWPWWHGLLFTYLSFLNIFETT